MPGNSKIRMKKAHCVTTEPPSSSGGDLAVLDGVRAWAAAAGVVIVAGWEGRAFGRYGIRIVTVNDVITWAASDHVTAEVSVQLVVVGTAGDHVIERAAAGRVVARAAGNRVDAAHADEHIRAGTAFYGVVAAQADQRVLAGPAEQGVVIGSV